MSLPRHWRLPSGNDFISLPSLSAQDFSLPDLNLTSMRLRGLVEFKGAKGAPLFAPLVKIDGKALDLGKLKQAVIGREDFWTPTYSAKVDGQWELRLRVVSPPSERGFFLDLRLRNLSAKKALKGVLGAQGSWGAMSLRINETYDLPYWRKAELYKGLAAKHVVLSTGLGAPEFALSLGSPDDLDVYEVSNKGGIAKYALSKNGVIQPGQELRVGITVGTGLDAPSAAAVNVEFKRRGLGPLSGQTGRWLQHRKRQTGDARLDDLLNWNSFFNLFFATGVTVDSEQFVSLTSRSPHYYVCGSYWDRDALLWSLPAIQMVDTQRARKVLEYAFLVQGRNIGVHSRFMDGVVLEPGFELDELCAPVIALANYVKQTGDQGLLKDFQVRDVLRRFERTLSSHKHPNLPLYDTLSGPDDDHEPQGYLTYDNVLVWKALLSLAELKERQGRGDEAKPLKEQAERVRQAIWQKLTVAGPRGNVFVWSSDLRGAHRLYTSPPGCLQLLPFFGFCSQDDPTWRNTAAYLHSREYNYSFAGERYAEIGCNHSTQPWTLSLCNSLLSGRHEQAKALLQTLEMDGGIACEAFDSKTGKPFSGSAFATCAGFLAFAIHKAFGKTPEGMQRSQQQAAPAPRLNPSGNFRQGQPQQQRQGGQRPPQNSRPGQQAPQPPRPIPQAAPKPVVAVPSQPPARPGQAIGGITLKGGKRSTKGVAAVVPNEPVRPMPAAPSKGSKKAAAAKPKPKSFKIKPKKR